MSGTGLRLLRGLYQGLLGNRRWMLRHLERIAATTAGQDVLELGSGRQDLGADRYSAAHLFADRNRVRRTDANPAHGHEVVDATAMPFDGEFDLVLCCNVLEHVYEHGAAIAGIHRALRPGGVAVLVVPMFFPFHDEPHDYWRFSEHALRRLLADFVAVDIRHRGLRRAPFSYLVTAVRPASGSGGTRASNT